MIKINVEDVKAIIECGAFVLAVFTAWDGVQKAHRDRGDTLEQAKKDLLWRQTVEAQSAVRRMVSNRLAETAMTMLDWNRRKYQLPNGTRLPISWEDMRQSLRVDHLQFEPQETYVRSCFDALFDEYQMIQQAIDSGMFDYKEIQYPLGYYSLRMKHPINWPAFHAYLKRYGFVRALRLIEKTYKEAKEHPDEDVNAVFSDIDSAQKEEEEQNKDDEKEQVEEGKEETRC